MQRPRRTAEFCEEPGTASKRNSRPQQRVTWAPSPGPSAAPKYNTRQSRIARPSSTDRQTLLQPSSALRGSRTTPQRTPTPNNNKKLTGSVLFTAEKQRNAHNDKKWVQEKAQEITEHLSDAAIAGAIEGLPPEFFSRAGCLRQMSTKQFVAIINYFLHCIWGNRFTVGTNYVDDIANILQKLQYPHQVNKSWLKTPNTPHSFGYVIMLFDFLMDFVSHGSAAEPFPFQEPLAHSQSMTEEQLPQIPDIEFQAQMLRHSEEGFSLWDKQSMEEFANLQRQSCSVLIQKRCGLPGLEAVDSEMDELSKKLNQLRKQRPHIGEEDEAQCDRLEAELKRTQADMHEARTQYEAGERRNKQLQTEHKAAKQEMVNLQEEIAKIQTMLKEQTYNIEQRDQLIEEVAQMKHALKCHDQTMQELQDRLYQQKTQVWGNKKQLIDKIASFNGHMREITYAKLHNNADELQLGLSPQTSDVTTRLCTLHELQTLTKAQIQKYRGQQQKLEQRSREIEHEIAISLEPKTNALSAALSVSQHSLQKCVQQTKKMRQLLDVKLQQLETRLRDLEPQIAELQKSNLEKQKQLQHLWTENDGIMKKAEQDYNECSNSREKFLNQYEMALKNANGVMQHFAECVKQRGVLLQKFYDEKNK